MNAIGTTGTVFGSTFASSDVYYVKCRDEFGNTMSNAAFIQVAEV